MRKRRSGRVFVILGSLFIVAAFLLSGYNIWNDFCAGKSSSNAFNKIVDAQSDSDAVPDYILNPYMEMPTVEIDGYRYIGTLSVPEINLELPIMENWSYTKMKIAPCRYSGSAYLSNMVICGHNYRSHFGKLRKLDTNDEIIFTDVDGNVFKYNVFETEVLRDTAVDEMVENNGDWDLTLFTCTVGGRARFTVRCTQADKNSYSANLMQ